METKSLVYVYPLLRRSTIIVLDKNDNICVNSQIVNSFTTGCDIMKKECVTNHEYRKGKLLHIIYNVVSISGFHSPFQNYNLAQHSR
jgi:hypothetical protein